MLLFNVASHTSKADLNLDCFCLGRPPIRVVGLFFLSSAMAGLEGGKGAFAIGGRIACQTCRALPSPVVTVTTEGVHIVDTLGSGVSMTPPVKAGYTPA